MAMNVNRIRLTYAMTLIAVIALIFNHFRPLGREEAIRAAVALLKMNHPEGVWSSSSASAIVPTMGKMWVVVVADGHRVRQADEDALDRPVATVLVHFDGRCFRWGVDSCGVRGSITYDVDEFGKRSVMAFEVQGVDTDTIFEREGRR